MACARKYRLPLLSVTEMTRASPSAQAMKTTFKSPAVCKLGNVATTTDCLSSVEVDAPCTYAIVAPAAATVRSASSRLEQSNRKRAALSICEGATRRSRVARGIGKHTGQSPVARRSVRRFYVQGCQSATSAAALAAPVQLLRGMRRD